jgi:hypothetical protein
LKKDNQLIKKMKLKFPNIDSEIQDVLKKVDEIWVEVVKCFKEKGDLTHEDFIETLRIARFRRILHGLLKPNKDMICQNCGELCENEVCSEECEDELNKKMDKQEYIQTEKVWEE